MSSIFGAYAANLKVNKNEVAIKEDLNVFSFKSFFLFCPTSGCGVLFFFWEILFYLIIMNMAFYRDANTWVQGKEKMCYRYSIRKSPS